MKTASFSIAILNFFLGMVNIFILQKISSERDHLQHFCTFAVILDKFAALFELVMTQIFHRKKLVDIGAENLSDLL